jgi:hypothetical protein
MREEIKLALETEEKKDKSDGKKYEVITSISAVGLRSNLDDTNKFIMFSINPNQSPVQDKYTPPPDRA